MSDRTATAYPYYYYGLPDTDMWSISRDGPVRWLRAPSNSFVCNTSSESEQGPRGCGAGRLRSIFLQIHWNSGRNRQQANVGTDK